METKNINREQDREEIETYLSIFKRIPTDPLLNNRDISLLMTLLAGKINQRFKECLAEDINPETDLDLEDLSMLRWKFERCVGWDDIKKTMKKDREQEAFAEAF